MTRFLESPQATLLYARHSPIARAPFDWASLCQPMRFDLKPVTRREAVVRFEKLRYLISFSFFEFLDLNASLPRAEMSTFKLSFRLSELRR